MSEFRDEILRRLEVIEAYRHGLLEAYHRDRPRPVDEDRLRRISRELLKESDEVLRRTLR